MIVGIGTDLIEVARIRKAMARHGKRFTQRVLTASEQNICDSKRDSVAWLAKRFAAKEAASKALGTGIGKISWQDFEIRNNGAGAPELILYRAAAQRLQELGGSRALLSLADEREFVMAFVVLEG